MTDLGASKSTDHSGMTGMSGTKPGAKRPYRSLAFWFRVTNDGAPVIIGALSAELLCNSPAG